MISVLIMLLAAPVVVINTEQEKQFSAEAAGNLITNPGFESGSGNMPAGWERGFWNEQRSSWEWISDGSTVRSGIGSAKITSSEPNDASWIQDVSVEPYSSYLFKSWIKTEDVVLSDPPGGWSTGANLSVYLSRNRSPGIWETQDWTEESLFFCSIASNTVTVAARIGYNWSLVTGTVYFDDMSLEERDPPFRGQHVVVCFLPEHRSLLTDPNGWLQKLDDAYLALQDLTGETPYGGDKILIQEVVNYAGGLMIAGNPILWFGDYVPGALNAINDYNDLSFGPIHELSHDFDVYGSYYAGGGPINPEHWGNFKLTYVADTLSSVYPTATFYHSSQGYLPIGEFSYQYFVVEFAQPWMDAGRTDWENMNNDVYTGLLYLLKEDIGWKPFKQTFRDYEALTEPPPATDLEKVEFFAHLLSANAGEDVTPYFQSWGFPISSAPDTFPPSVSITAPANGSTVADTVNVTADATDDTGVTKVEFYVDGQLKSTDTSSPYSYSWDTTSVSNGNISLLVKAFDAVPNTATDTIAVTVSNDTGGPSPPTANIKANNSNGPITIYYNAAATISWTSTNTSSCSVSPTGWTGKSGSKSTGRLTSEKTYTLSCSGGGGSASDSVTVKVVKLGDLNRDGEINIRDLSILLSKWASTNATADLDNSGRVNIRDLSILLSRWRSY
jgi:hypothetical protein